MISSLEVIERSIYDAILRQAIREGVALDPNLYHPITPESTAKYKDDVSKLSTHVQVFGAGENLSKGLKVTPRIVVDPQGFYPGSIGLPRSTMSLGENGMYNPTEIAYETLDQMVNIRLVSSNQSDNRLLHNILYKAIPQRGYIKPYYNEQLQDTGNIFIEVVNFYNRPDYDQGIIEKEYQFAIYDCLLEVPQNIEEITPIKQIEIFLDNEKLLTSK